MTDEPTLKLRCPNDIARPESGAHVRVDIGQPISLGILSRLLKELDQCPCGALMDFLHDGECDPWRHDV